MTITMQKGRVPWHSEFFTGRNAKLMQQKMRLLICIATMDVANMYCYRIIQRLALSIQIEQHGNIKLRYLCEDSLQITSFINVS